MSNTDTKTDISHRQLNRMQRNSLCCVLSYLRGWNRLDAYSIRYNIQKGWETRGGYKTFVVTIRSRRDDSQRYSPRAIATEWYLSFCIGGRGAIEIWQCSYGLTDWKDNIAKSLNAKTR